MKNSGEAFLASLLIADVMQYLEKIRNRASQRGRVQHHASGRRRYPRQYGVQMTNKIFLVHRMLCITRFVLTRRFDVIAKGIYVPRPVPKYLLSIHNHALAIDLDSFVM